MCEEKINELDVNDSWKKKFLTICEAKPISLGFIPKFENSKELNYGAKMNFLAFFFGPIYYMIKGMWKKGLVVFGLSIVLMVVIAMINPNLVQFVGYGIGALCITMANNDFYRFKVLNEGNFWW